MSRPSIANSNDSTASVTLTIGGLQVLIAPGDEVSLVNGCLGDVNGDGKLTLRDAALTLRAFGTRPGDRRWNPDADLNNDGIVGLVDLLIVGRALIDPSC